jgi:S1-C subfamily serine protease
MNVFDDATNFTTWFPAEPDQLKIFTVNPWSPAYEAGLREGDVITRIDGQVFRNIFDIYSYLLNSDIGQVVSFEYQRDGHGMPPIAVTLVEKETRYFGRTINAGGYGAWSGYDTSYTADLTY